MAVSNFFGDIYGKKKKVLPHKPKDRVMVHKPCQNACKKKGHVCCVSKSIEVCLFSPNLRGVCRL
jgi:hypothetical protein